MARTIAKKAASSDQITLDLITEVKNRKAEINKILGKPSYITNCTFTYVEGRMNEAINIHVMSDVRELINIASFLRGREVLFAETASLLGVENPPKFTWQGFTVSDWLEDLKTRLAKIQVAAKQKKLEALEARLNLVISPELRAKMELEAIASELG
jgi:hypothetical protein